VSLKKKLVITFSICGAIIIALSVALISVFAAFTATTEGGTFSVSYTAYNVNATVTATATSGSTTITLTDSANSNEFLKFSGSEPEGTTKTFANPSGITLTKTTREAILCYAIKNDNTTATADSQIKVTVTPTGVSTTGDITLSYKMYNDQTSKPTPSGWATSVSAAWGTGDVRITAAKTLYFFVRVALPDAATKANPAQSSFTGAFNFTLSMT